MFKFKTKAERLAEEIDRVATADAKLMIDTQTDLTERNVMGLFRTSVLATRPEAYASYCKILMHRIDSVNHG